MSLRWICDEKYVEYMLKNTYKENLKLSRLKKIYIF